MLLGSSLLEGQHVVARRDLNGWLGPIGYPRVRKGTRGVVVRRPSGILGSRYVVEFVRGGRMSVSGRDLKPTLLGPSSDLRSGVRIGLFVAAVVPTAFAVVGYYVHGGTTSGLIAALPAATLTSIEDLVGAIATVTGIPATLIGLLVIWVLLKRKRG